MWRRPSVGGDQPCRHGAPSVRDPGSPPCDPAPDNRSHHAWVGATAHVSGNTDTRQGILDTAHRIVGAQGFFGVGLTKILAAAGVPKGSYYPSFCPKEAFGEALLAEPFTENLAAIDATLAEPGLSHAERLMNDWRKWQAMQGSTDGQRKCPAVKLAAEVSDLSEPVRLALKTGPEVTCRADTVPMRTEARPSREDNAEATGGGMSTHRN